MDDANANISSPPTQEHHEYEPGSLIHDIMQETGPEEWVHYNVADFWANLEDPNAPSTPAMLWLYADIDELRETDDANANISSPPMKEPHEYEPGSLIHDTMQEVGPEGWVHYNVEDVLANLRDPNALPIPALLPLNAYIDARIRETGTSSSVRTATRSRTQTSPPTFPPDLEGSDGGTRASGSKEGLEGADIVDFELKEETLDEDDR